jgi:hypothetical protein
MYFSLQVFTILVYTKILLICSRDPESDAEPVRKVRNCNTACTVIRICILCRSKVQLFEEFHQHNRYDFTNLSKYLPEDHIANGITTVKLYFITEMPSMFLGLRNYSSEKMFQMLFRNQRFSFISPAQLRI